MSCWSYSDASMPLFLMYGDDDLAKWNYKLRGLTSVTGGYRNLSVFGFRNDETNIEFPRFTGIRCVC